MTHFLTEGTHVKCNDNWDFMSVSPVTTVTVDNPTEGSDSTLVGVGVIASLGVFLLIIALLDIHTLLVNPKQRKKAKKHVYK